MRHLDIEARGLIADLQRRIDRWRSTGDSALVLDQRVHETVQRLHPQIVGGRADAADLVTVGLWYLCRYQVLSSGYGQADLRSARAIAALVRQTWPDALPTELANLIGNGPHTGSPLEVATNLLGRFEVHGDVAAAREARALLTAATHAAAPDDPALPASLANLAYVQTIEFIVNDDVPDVETAVRLAREAVAAATGDRGARGYALTVLCRALGLRGQRTGSLADLDEAIRLGHNAVVTSDTPTGRARAIDCLSQALWTRSERTGGVADLDEAVRLARVAVGLVPRAHPFFTICFGSLVICLARRFQRLGNVADGDEAIELGRELLALVPAGDPQRCVDLANHALALLGRYLRSGARDDLTDAMRASADAVAASGKYGGHQHWILSNHGLVHFIRYLDTAVPDDAATAIASVRKAISATGEDDPRRPLHGRTLAHMLLARSRHTLIPDDVAEALELGRAAVAATSPGHPSRASCLNTLADACHRQYGLTSDPADLDAAVGLWRSAVGSRVSPAETRMNAARAWHQAAVAADNVPFAAECCVAAIGLLPILAWRGLDRISQEKRLAGVAGLAGDAAAYAARTGEPARAVELLEQGRSVLWAQALQTRTDLTDLRDVAPDLAERLNTVRLALDGGRPPSPSTKDSGADDLVAGEYRKLAGQWDDLVRTARGLPGFEHFLGPAPFDHLRQAAVDGPVVIVNTSYLRCDAFVVSPSDVRTVPLPWLTVRDVHARATVLLEAQREAETDRGTVARAHFRQTLTSLLRWLWDTVAEPVLAATQDLLPANENGAPARLWWCPTGPLTLLPLHAAGRYGTSAAWRRRRWPTVPDQVVSSYTTGLAALIRARTRAPAGEPRLLAIGMPATDGMAALSGVDDELRRIGLPDTTVLIGADATTDRVLAGLRGHSWAHFACHGTQDIQQPSTGAIHLSDGPLTVLRFAANALTEAEFAYLSACHTATGSPALADEAIHLMAALQLAGYRHVIGTQWSIGDEHAADVSASVYRHLTSAGRPDPAEAAVALHHAVATLRAAHPDRPDIWAPYVHAGP